MPSGGTAAGFGARGASRTVFGRDAVEEEGEGHPVLGGDEAAHDPAPAPAGPSQTSMGGAGRTITARGPLDVGTSVGVGARGRSAHAPPPAAERSSTRFGIHLLDEDPGAQAPSDTSLGGTPGTMVGVPGTELDELLDLPEQPEKLDDAWLDDVSDYLRDAESGRGGGADPTAVRPPQRTTSGESPTVELDFDMSLFHEQALPLRPGSATGPRQAVRDPADDSMAVGGRRPMLSGDQPTVKLDGPGQHLSPGDLLPGFAPADTDGPGGPVPESTSFGLGAVSDEPFEPVAEDDDDGLDDVFMDFADGNEPHEDPMPDDLDFDFDDVDEAALNDAPPLAGIMKRRPARRKKPAAKPVPRVGDAPRTGSRLALGESSAREVLQTIEGGRRPVSPAVAADRGAQAPEVTLDSSPLTLSAYDRPSQPSTKPRIPDDDVYGETAFAPDELAYASTGSLPPIPDRLPRPDLGPSDDEFGPDYAGTFDDRKPAPEQPAPSPPPVRDTRSGRRSRQPALAAVQYVASAEPEHADVPATDDGWYAAEAEAFDGAGAGFGGSTVDMARGADELRDYIAESPHDNADLFGGPPPPASDAYPTPFDDAPATDVGSNATTRAPSRALVVTLAVLVLAAVTLGAFIVLKVFVL